MNFITDTKHLRVSSNMLSSKYFNYVLSAVDSKIFLTLWDKIRAPKDEYYNKGLLVAQISVNNITSYTNIPRSSVKRSLSKLNKLGVIITIHENGGNNKYILGFRSMNNEWLLFIYHLIAVHEDVLKTHIREGIDLSENINMFKMNDAYIDYIRIYHNNVNFYTEKLNNGYTICELLFGRQDPYSLPRLVCVR